MNNKFQKYFSKSFVKEGIDPLVDDKAVFDQSFEDANNVQQLDQEIADVTISPEERMMILKKADKYAENINSHILPMLRRLHDSIVSGEFKSIAPDIKGISNITEDLAKLSESLRGKTRDAILKANQKDEKK